VAPSEIVRRLAEAYPEARCELDFASRWQLLVATVLSAQSTDQRVNSITPALFARWPEPEDVAGADLDELERAMRAVGLQRSKARALKAAAQRVADLHGGRVPGDFEALLELPGVGRKTAKVVLGVGFDRVEGIAVDTHVRRVARRLGLTREQDPERVAADLEALVPRSEWVRFSLRVVLHGRRTCTARRPRCESCVLRDLCPRVGVT